MAMKKMKCIKGSIIPHLSKGETYYMDTNTKFVRDGNEYADFYQTPLKETYLGCYKTKNFIRER